MFNLRQVAALVLTSALSASAFAAGYEKNIIWSGRHNGVAGVGTAWSAGGEALFFNPAGLATEQGKREIVGNLSVISSQYEGPVIANNTNMKSERANSIAPAIFYGANPTDKLGYGIGFYALGGSTVEYKDIDLTSLSANFTSRPTMKTAMSVSELSAGVGYKIMPGLKFGAAYRFLMVDAEFVSVGLNAAGTAVVVPSITDIKGTQHGFRTGIQWAPEEKPFGLGLTYRSTMHIQASGDLSATVDTAAPGGAGDGALAGTASRATIKTVFPQQLNFGGFWDIVPEAWRAHGEYIWTQYSRNQFLAVEGNVGGVDSPDFGQSWKDQHSIRLGAEYMKTKYPVRVGYIWNGGVENPAYARASFAAPGVAHTVTLGTGRGNEKWDFNIAADYTFVKRDNVVVDTTVNNIGARNGDYKTTALGIHSGVTYKF